MLCFEMEAEQTEKKVRRFKISWTSGLFVVIIAVLAGTGIYFYLKYQHTQALLRDPTAAVQEELNNIVMKVGKHIELPTGEAPNVATVSDKNALAGQQFFAKAETGDKVLIYLQAKKVILYRPSIDKIIEVAPVNLNQEVAGTSTTSAQLKTAKLTIYNGTGTVGLAGVAEKKIKEMMPDIQTLKKVNAEGIYKESMVVILNTQAQDLGVKLKDLINAGITANLPAGETKPETDLLLIVGEDFQP